MQVKTVKRVVSNKMKAWTETITDESLRKDVENNLLVTGGCIASLLLGEPVNDFDVYIKDINVLKRLCLYYTKGLDIEVLDGRLIDALSEEFSNTNNGNSIYSIDNIRSIELRNLKEDQIKLSVGSGVLMKENQGKTGYVPSFFSPNAISLTDDLQIVCRFHGDSKQIHTTFDFIHATNYYTKEEGLVLNQKALECLLTKQLKYQGSLYPLTSIIRMKKFIKRGWNISAGEILKVMFQISQLDLRNPDILAEQLIGVDVAYFGKLIEILRGVPSEKITSSYLNEIIDRFFNDFEEEV